jgi:TP901 family phage tail tape measure protein
VSIKIRIVSDFDKRGLTEAEKALNGLSKAAGIALAAVGAAVAGIAVKSVQEFAKFDAALTQSKAIMGDLTKVMEDDMARAAREVAKATTFSAEEAGQSFFYLASAGLDAEASIAALPRVAQFAQAGMFDMSRATDLLTDAQSALGLTIRDDAVKNMENMIKVSDVLVRANTLSNATVEQFSTSLTTKAGPALRTLGKDMEEGVAVLAAFADQGIKGEEAGTQLSIVLRDLSTKAIKNKEDFAQFGVSVFDANGEMRNLGDIIANLEMALDGMSDETQKATLLQMGFADRSVQSILALLGTSDAIKAYETELRSATGFTDQVANKQLETFNSQLKLLESAFIDVAIQIGEELTPYLQDLIPVIQDLLPIIGRKIADAIKEVDWKGLIEDVADFITLVVDNIDTIAEIAEGLLIAAGALVGYQVATKLATTATALFNSTLRLNPWGLLITGLGLAVIGFAQYADEVYGSKVNTDGMTEAQAKQAKSLEGLRQLQKQYERALDDSNESNRQLAEDGLKRVRDSIARVEYSLKTTSGEMSRFNNMSLAGIRNEMRETGELGLKLANQQRQLYFAMKGLDPNLGLFEQEPEGGGGGGGPSAFEQARERVQSLIKDSQKALAEAQKQYNKTVEDANRSYAENVERLQIEYAKRLEGIIQQSQDRLRNAYKSAVETNIAALFERDEDKSVAGLVKSLSDKLTASRNLLSNSAELASAGFSQTFIEQIVSAGTETGNELASAILNSTPEVQRELQSLFQALEIESNQGMDALAEQIYERQGLATQALVNLYAQTQAEQANAMIDLQTQLDEALTNAATILQDSIRSIKDNVLEQIAEMDSGLGGLGKTVEQFISKLDSLIQKQREAQQALDMPVTVPAPAAPSAPSIAFQPVPSQTAPVVSQPIVNVNVKTDTTQSPAMVGKVIAKEVERYTSLGGGIKGIKVVAL